MHDSEGVLGQLKGIFTLIYIFVNTEFYSFIDFLTLVLDHMLDINVCRISSHALILYIGMFA